MTITARFEFATANDTERLSFLDWKWDPTVALIITADVMLSPDWTPRRANLIGDYDDATSTGWGISIENDGRFRFVVGGGTTNYAGFVAPPEGATFLGERLELVAAIDPGVRSAELNVTLAGYGTLRTVFGWGGREEPLPSSILPLIVGAKADLQFNQGWHGSVWNVGTLGAAMNVEFDPLDSRLDLTSGPVEATWDDRFGNLIRGFGVTAEEMEPTYTTSRPRLLVEFDVAGEQFTLDHEEYSLLSAGNILGPVDDRWRDLGCDVVVAGWREGATNSDGGRRTPLEIGTAELQVLDPERKWDPTNPNAEYRDGIAPGTGMRIRARWSMTNNAPDEYVPLWIGRIATIAHQDRITSLTGEDNLSRLVRYQQPGRETPVGAGDTVIPRVDRILADAQWLDGVIYGPNTAANDWAFIGTDLARPSWEHLVQVAQNVHGFAWQAPTGELVVHSAEDWWPIGAASKPVDLYITDAICLGVDVLTVSQTSLANMINTLDYASEGGSSSTIADPSSQSRYGIYRYGRTDLQLLTQPHRDTWATSILEDGAGPKGGTVTEVGFHPERVPVKADRDGLWDQLLGAQPGTVIQIVMPEHERLGEISLGVGLFHLVTADDWLVGFATTSMDQPGADHVLEIDHPPDADLEIGNPALT